MRRSSRFAIALALTVSGAIGATSVEAAPTASQRQRDAVPTSSLPTRPRLAAPDRAPASLTLPAPITFKETDGRGFVAQVWINGAGPFTFAIDTGAGGNIISDRV